MRQQLVRLVVLAGLIGLLAPPRLYAPTFTTTWTYYNDYFVTAVGGTIRECDNFIWSWGTPDGVYRTVETYSCTGSFHYTACNQKINGEWVEISCP